MKPSIRAVLSGVFLILFGYGLRAQQLNLSKFRVERLGTDGLIYVFEGMQDENGKQVIPANYDYIWEFSDSLTLARRRIDIGTSDNEGAFSYEVISNKGYLYYEFPDYLVPENLSEGLIRTWNSRIGKYGFLDTRGKTVVKFNYDNARDFSEGWAAVKRNVKSHWDYIDSQGQNKTNFSFDVAYSFSEGLAVVKLNDKFSYVNKGGVLTPINGDYIQVFDVKDGFSIVTAEKNDSLLYGFIKNNGEQVVKPTYDFIDNFEENAAVFLKNGKAGMISSSGEVLIPARYDELFRFDQAHYLFQQNGLQGLVALDGRQILPADYRAIGLFHEGLCAVQKGNLWGFANTEGDEVIPCRYSEVGSVFVNGIAQVHLPDQWYMVKGQDTLTLPAYDEVLPFYGYSAAFRIGNQWGFLNQQGEESVEARFDELVFNKGAIVFGRNSFEDGTFLWSVIDPYGREVQIQKYNEVVRFSEGFAAVRNGDNWGFINSLGTEVVQPQFETVRNYSSGLAAVMKNNEWGFVNSKGIEEIPLFIGMPSLDEMTGNTVADTINAIRETYPLFLMEVLGDFKDNCACVEDISLNHSGDASVCVNKSGKVNPQLSCEPYTKTAELFIPEAELNPTIKIVRRTGRWIFIDQSGNEVPKQ
ncbi:MAG: WG repeat-containing protein [Bacteroidetes bacterium]|nr:WG repeat-containing protein [Bacteroidota bacterium]